MSEYWKSTPKYWCKHCSTYVRDTKLEKTNHEATPKHQGNLKRFLRDLHRGHEKEEKDKERAKAEVARLNGMTSGGGAGPGSIATSSGIGRGPTPSLPKPQATAAQRKQQLAQLVEMGVSIPDAFRPDMAMAGDWQVTAERVIEPEGEKKPDALALGVRKRAAEEDEEGEGETENKKRRWGSTYKTHPAATDDADLETLLSNVTRKGNAPAAEVKEEIKPHIKEEPGVGDLPGDNPSEIPASDEKLGIKTESPDGENPLLAVTPASDTGVVFKKRKAKNIRQK